MRPALNGYALEAADEDVVAHMLALAAGKPTAARLAAWIRQKEASHGRILTQSRT